MLSLDQSKCLFTRFPSRRFSESFPLPWNHKGSKAVHWRACLSEAPGWRELLYVQSWSDKQHLELKKNYIMSNKQRTGKLTGWWIHCSSSWGGSQSSAPRRHAVWFVHRVQRHYGWPHETWRQNCPGSCAWTAAGGLVCWSRAATPAPVKDAQNTFYHNVLTYIFEDVRWCVMLPQWKWGLHFQSDWWHGPKTYTSLRRSFGWSGGSGQWIDLAAARQELLATNTVSI